MILKFDNINRAIGNSGSHLQPLNAIQRHNTGGFKWIPIGHISSQLPRTLQSSHKLHAWLRFDSIQACSLGRIRFLFACNPLKIFQISQASGYQFSSRSQLQVFLSRSVHTCECEVVCLCVLRRTYAMLVCYVFSIQVLCILAAASPSRSRAMSVVDKA
jgi:hypothetical protein